jgi:hypothetical protein
LFFVLGITICTGNSLFAQYRYAVLIAGDYNDANIPIEHRWNNATGVSQNWEEFWNDAFLWNEVLTKSFYDGGYQYTDVKVLIADGSNYPDPEEYNSRYLTENNFPLAYSSATYSNLENVFQNLATTLTEDDFIFVWTMGHGGYDSSVDDYILYLHNSVITATQFTTLLNNINAGKKVVFMQQPYSGGFDNFTSGDNTIFYSSSSNVQNAYRANDTPDEENEIWFTPGVGLKKYYHGEFNFHTYSSIRGESPGYQTGYNGDLYLQADKNGDNIISISEAHQWEDSRSNSICTSQFSDLSGIATTTSLKYPTIIPMDESTNITLSGVIGITHEVKVLSGCTLTIEDNSKVYLDYDGKIIVENGGSLILGDNVEINAFYQPDIQREIVINGHFDLGINVFFILHKETFILPSEVFKITINNSNLEIEFNYTKFEYVLIVTKNILNTFSDCKLRPASLIGHNGDYYFNDCEIAGEIHLNSRMNDYNAEIIRCEFKGVEGQTAVKIENYKRVIIDDSEFKVSCGLGYDVAIFLLNSGSIAGIIKNCSIMQCHDAGIVSYNSNIRIHDNYIFGNKFGLKCLNKSNLSVFGTSNYVTQIFKESGYVEIYSTPESFPYNIQKNYFLRLSYTNFIQCTEEQEKLYIVSNNAWNEPDPEPYLLPVGQFIWQDVWIPDLSGLKSDEIPETMFFNAMNKIENNHFIDAKNDLIQLIHEFPSSRFSRAAIRELFEIEEFCSNDFFSLKMYFKTDTVIQNNLTLLKQAVFFANQCEIKLQNWPAAISWFEDVIQNPDSFEDSLFAIIDLGYTYLLMADSGYKSTYTGRLPEYIPVTRDQFSKNRDYLLSLIPNDRSNSIIQENLSLLKYGELLQNVPNPFSGSTQIWFKIEEKSFVMIHVFDYTGKRIKTFNRGMLEKGTHSANFSANDAGSATGLYFYSLEINGHFTDSKKMTILK